MTMLQKWGLINIAISLFLHDIFGGKAGWISALLAIVFLVSDVFREPRAREQVERFEKGKI